MNEIKTLEDLVQKKDKLITVIGVFGAIAAFSIEFNSYLMAFSALGIFLLLSWELYRDIPHPGENIDPQETTFISSLQMLEVLFLGFILAIYFYVGNYAFILHPETKFVFIFIFIFIPIANFLWIFTDKWMKTPEITNLKMNKRGFRLWIISMIILLPILWAEISYLVVKFFEYVKY